MGTLIQDKFWVIFAKFELASVNGLLKVTTNENIAQAERKQIQYNLKWNQLKCVVAVDGGKNLYRVENGFIGHTCKSYKLGSF